eukprot:scaffold25384_cov129-Isochrysis_galbana.AAC.4
MATAVAPCAPSKKANSDGIAQQIANLAHSGDSISGPWCDILALECALYPPLARSSLSLSPDSPGGDQRCRL